MITPDEIEELAADEVVRFLDTGLEFLDVAENLGDVGDDVLEAVYDRAQDILSDIHDTFTLKNYAREN